MEKQIHYYDIDKDWLYLSSENAYLNEQETEKQGHPVYYCPYNATLVDLPELEEYEVAKFNGTDWDVLKDYRGRYQVDENMEVSEINYVGDIQEGYILITDEQAETIMNDIDYYIIDNGQLIPNPDYEEIKRRKYREYLDNLKLTPSDVERALLAAKGMDFTDLQAFLKTKGYTDLQIKAIGVELRANNFFRGATLKGTDIRIVDTIGALLEYSSEDMDYLFLHKELPEKNGETT